MERLFVFRATRARYLEAPLMKERDDFITHLLQQGCSHRRLQSVAALLLAVIHIMDVSAMRSVNSAEIEEAAERWSKDAVAHRGRGAGPTSARTFIYVAEKWFSFHGQLIVPPPTVHPYEEIMDEFAHSMLHAKGLSRETIRGYCSRSTLFLDWLAAVRGKSISETSIMDVDAFLDSKRLSGWKPRSVATQCQALRSFFRYAETRGWCTANLPRGIHSPCLPKYDAVPQGPPWKDIRRMLEPVSDKPADLKAAAVLSLCAIYGLRSSEIANLKLSDFDWANETFTIRRAKRGRIQQYPIQYAVGEKLIAYLRGGRPPCQCRNVFVTRNPPYRPMGKTTLWLIVAKSMERLGIESEHRGPHALRHSCATQLLRKGSSLRDIADFLGHRDLKSVSIYAKFDIRSLRQVAAFSLAGLQ